MAQVGPAREPASSTSGISGKATPKQQKEATAVHNIAPRIIQSLKAESKGKFTSNVTVNPAIVNRVKVEHRANAIIDHLGVVHIPLPPEGQGTEETKS